MKKNGDVVIEDKDLDEQISIFEQKHEKLIEELNKVQKKISVNYRRLKTLREKRDKIELSKL